MKELACEVVWAWPMRYLSTADGTSSKGMKQSACRRDSAANGTVATDWIVPNRLAGHLSQLVAQIAHAPEKSGKKGGQKGGRTMTSGGVTTK